MMSNNHQDEILKNISNIHDTDRMMHNVKTVITERKYHQGQKNNYMQKTNPVVLISLVKAVPIYKRRHNFHDTLTVVMDVNLNSFKKSRKRLYA